MIVSREYIPFRKLISSYDKGGKIFINLCKKAYPADMWEEAFLKLSDYALYEREMSWAFRGIGKLIDEFHRLDIEDPYDTGYDLTDASTADILHKEGNTMTLLLRTEKNSGNDIVGVITVEISNQNF